MAADLFVILNTLICFVLAILLQIAYFRHTKQHNVINSLKTVMLGAIFIDLIFIIAINYCVDNFAIVEISYITRIGLIVLSYIIFVIMYYVYTLYIFGVYESAIRIRLLREIVDSGSHGITLAQIKEHYNGAMIIKKRLARLVNSGEIIYDCNTKDYREGKQSVFRIQAYIIYKLRKLLFQRHD